MDAFKVHASSIRRTARQLLAIADRMDPPVVPAKASPVARLICPDCGTEYAGPEYRHGDPCLTVRCEGLIARKSDLARTCSCDRCGLQLNGAHRDGLPCDSSGPTLGICWGTFRLDPDPDIATCKDDPRRIPAWIVDLAPESEWCICDRCGGQLLGRQFAKKPCDFVEDGVRCSGTFRRVPADPLMTWCDKCEGTGKYYGTYGELIDSGGLLADCLACKGTGKQPVPGPDEPLTDRQGRPYGVTRDELVAEMIRHFVVGGTDDLPVPGLDIASTYRGRAR